MTTKDQSPAPEPVKKVVPDLPPVFAFLSPPGRFFRNSAGYYVRLPHRFAFSPDFSRVALQKKRSLTKAEANSKEYALKSYVWETVQEFDVSALSVDGGKLVADGKTVFELK